MNLGCQKRSIDYHLSIFMFSNQPVGTPNTILGSNSRVSQLGPLTQCWVVTLASDNTAALTLVNIAPSGTVSRSAMLTRDTGTWDTT